MAKKPGKKSTSKKKEEEKRKKPAKKTTAKKPVAKKAAKKTTAPKPRAAAKSKKAVASKPKATKSKKAAPRKPAKKKVSVSDLLLKKFEKLGPQSVASFNRPRQPATAAPALIPDGEREEAERLRALLLQKFDYAALVEAAEKAAKKRAAAEKAAQEKAQAEKAAQKAAAEKAAREKAAAEKAAAEKAAQEKEAAEKAAAEQAKAEKTAARAEAERVTVTYATDDEKGTDTMDKTTKIVAAAVIGVLLLIGAASMSNMGHYYLRPTNKALEIWRGKFAPKGEKLFMTLPGVKAPASIKDVYSKQDVFPLIFNHYMAQADALLSKKKIPDFAAITTYLDQAAPFAATAALKESLSARQNTLDLMVLLYRAEAAASARTRAGLEKALAYLSQADRLARSDGEKALVAEKNAAIEKSLSAMRSVKAREIAARKKAATQKKPPPRHEAS